MTEKIENLTTQCPYCGVGCGLEMQPPAEIGKAVRRDADGYPMWRLEEIAIIHPTLDKYVLKVQP